MEGDAGALEQCYRSASFQQLLPFLSKFYPVTPRIVHESEHEPAAPTSPPTFPPPSRDEFQARVRELPPAQVIPARREDPGARSHRRVNTGRLEGQGGQTSGRRKDGRTCKIGELEHHEKTWTPEEDELLRSPVLTGPDIAQHFDGRSADDVKGRRMSSRETRTQNNVVRRRSQTPTDTAEQRSNRTLLPSVRHQTNPRCRGPRSKTKG